MDCILYVCMYEAHNLEWVLDSHPFPNFLIRSFSRFYLVDDAFRSFAYGTPGSWIRTFHVLV